MADSIVLQQVDTSDPITLGTDTYLQKALYQEFVGINTQVSKVALYLKGYGKDGFVNVAIKDMNGNTLASCSKYSGNLPSNPDWVEFSLNSLALLMEGVKYKISVEVSTNPSCYYNSFRIYCSASDIYPNNDLHVYLWDYSSTIKQAGDLAFKLYTSNQNPIISGSNQNLGNQSTPFTIDYTVNDTDAADTLVISEQLNGVELKSIFPAARNTNYTFSIPQDKWNALAQNSTNTITIRCSDNQGGSTTRTYTFTKVNSAPVISGSDINLGAKTAPFSYTYQVNDIDGDEITVVEKLNGVTIRTLNNAPKNADLTITLTTEQFYALVLNNIATLQIEARDSKSAVSYRTITFKRTNSAPVINGADESLGNITAPFSRTYQVTDPEADTVTIVEKIDDVKIRTFQAQQSTDYTITLTEDEWWKLGIGTHTLMIEATDANAATAIRAYTFNRTDIMVQFELKTPFETDIAATKIIVTPTWKIASGATAKVEACNNAFDAEPTWEDMTSQVLINRHYNFTNSTKTAAKWGVNVRFTVNKGTATELSAIDGFGGAFE